MGTAVLGLLPRVMLSHNREALEVEHTFQHTHLEVYSHNSFEVATLFSLPLAAVMYTLATRNLNSKTLYLIALDILVGVLHACAHSKIFLGGYTVHTTLLYFCLSVYLQEVRSQCLRSSSSNNKFL